MSDELKELMDKYSKKQTDKPEIEKPAHVQKYDEAQKRSEQRSKKNHQAAS